ncbi:MAG TPA: hypothetical protein VFQ65_15190 [Kofleriaceae bacterium]|nr:hypothetical protein [Kofleriaceae bacterium]
MKNLSIMFAMALSLAAFGCKKGGDCAAAIDHSMDLSKADMAKMPGADKMMGKMRDLGVQHCKDDKWSDEAVKCMNDAKTQADAQACYGKLSAEQREKMNKAAMEMMSPPAPTTGGAMGSDMGTTGSAATGSDMGSAAAGSAK